MHSGYLIILILFFLCFTMPLGRRLWIFPNFNYAVTTFYLLFLFMPSIEITFNLYSVVSHYITVLPHRIKCYSQVSSYTHSRPFLCILLLPRFRSFDVISTQSLISLMSFTTNLCICSWVLLLRFIPLAPISFICCDNYDTSPCPLINTVLLLYYVKPWRITSNFNPSQSSYLVC